MDSHRGSLQAMIARIWNGTRRITPVGAAVAVLGVLLSLGVSGSAHALVITLDQNFGSDPIEVQVTVVNGSGVDLGNLIFTLDVIDTNTGNIGDLRGLFFDLADETLLGGLSVVGGDVTDFDFDANSVTNLGGGSNINPEGPFDVGIEIGTPGIGSNDIQMTMFTLMHDSMALDVGTFFRSPADDTDFIMAARVTSVGPEGGSREGSSKVGGIDGGPPLEVPEPGLLLLMGTGLVAMGLARRRRRTG